MRELTRRSSREVLIVQEYVPEYRRAFFERLDASLRSRSVRMRVVVGKASAALAQRQDAAHGMSIVHEVPSWSLSIVGRRLMYRRLGTLAPNVDLIILEQALRHLESYPLLLRRRSRPRTALWGHGARLAGQRTRLEREVARSLTNRAHWFFAYTERGAEAVAKGGFPRSRVTVVQNTIDVAELARLREAVTPERAASFRTELGVRGRACLYLGALDSRKGLGLLLAACDKAATRDPDFTLIVAGDGPERGAVEDAARSHAWLRYVGRATGAKKALLAAVSDLLLVPASVGLVAVDSFALRTPIVTTYSPGHGPEIDYLTDGVNARFVEAGVDAYANAIEELLLDPRGLARLEEGCAASAGRYSLDIMVENFASGVISALEADDS